MWCRLIIEGNAVYEIDEECMKEKSGTGKRRRPGGEEKPGRAGKGGDRPKMD